MPLTHVPLCVSVVCFRVSPKRSERKKTERQRRAAAEEENLLRRRWILTRWRRLSWSTTTLLSMRIEQD
ncbi:unnamed protein product [Camellia sinensis]